MFFHRLGFLFLVVFILSACKPPGDSTETIKLRAENGRLESDVTHSLESKKQIEQQMLEMKEDFRRMKIRLENAEADRNKMEETLKKLEGEFSEYKGKYKTAIQSKIPGYPVVTGITQDSISLSHPSGIIRVARADIPAELVATLAIDQTTSVHAGIKSLLNEVALHKKGVGLINFSSSDNAAGVASSSVGSGDTNSSPKNQDVVLKSIATISILSSNGSSIGAGSGFIAQQADAIYFYTNAHVVSSSENLKVVFTGGQTLTLPGEMEISDEPEANDLVRFAVAAPQGVPVLQLLPEKIDIKTNSKILALGNSGGAGVIPVLRGRVKALGPFALEVDAEVIKGNSGGPVVFENSNTVVGVVTRYQPPSSRDMGIGGTQFGALRRICLRPDQVAKWKRTTLKQFTQEEKLIGQIATDNEILYSLRNANFSRYGIEGIHVDALALEDPATVGPAIAAQVTHVNSEMKTLGTRLTSEKRKQLFEEFSIEIRRLFSSGTTGSNSASFSHFYREHLQEQTKNRDTLSVVLGQHFTNELKNLP
ncbi:hypothetical protein BH11VER1_BH11VER1_22700 [soil metagenome]